MVGTSSADSTRMVQLGRGVVLLVLGGVVALVALIAAVAAVHDGQRRSVGARRDHDRVGGHPDPVRPWDLILAALFAMVFRRRRCARLRGRRAHAHVRQPERQALQSSCRTGRAPPSARPAPGAHPRSSSPARNEAASLPSPFGSAGRPDATADRVIVVARTTAPTPPPTVARGFGHGCSETVGNTHKKGGALNQALAAYLPEMDPDDAVMVMDADTALGPLYLRPPADLLDDPRPRGPWAGVLRRAGARPHRHLPAQRVPPVLPGDLTTPRPRLRPHRYGVGLPRLGPHDGRRRPRRFIPASPTTSTTPPPSPGQRDHHRAEVVGRHDGPPVDCKVETELMPDWRHLWRQRLPLAARRSGEHRGVRLHHRHRCATGGFGIASTASSLVSTSCWMIITLLAIDQWVWFPVLDRRRPRVRSGAQCSSPSQREGWKARFLAR